MTNLREISFGINQYCGPAVLSALTGESTDRCAAVISAVSGKKEIKAVNRSHLRQALERLRFDVEVTNYFGSTLYGVLYRLRAYDGLYVVFVPHHVIAVEVNKDEIYICDNHSKTPLDIKQSARLMQKVEAVWKVSRKSEPKFIKSEIVLGTSRGVIEINRYNIYEKEEDNTRVWLGSIRFENDKELNDIVNQLRKHLGWNI